MAETPQAPNTGASTMPEPPQPGRGPEPSLPGREGERGLPAPDWPRPGGERGWGGGPGGIGGPGEWPGEGHGEGPGEGPSGLPGERPGEGSWPQPPGGGSGGSGGYEPPAGRRAGGGSPGRGGPEGTGGGGERAGYGPDPGGFTPLPHLPSKGTGSGNGSEWDSGQDDPPEAPAAIHTAWFLYILAAVFSVISPLTAFLPGGRSLSIETLRDAVSSSPREYTDSELSDASTLVKFVAVVLVVVIAVVFLLVARRLFRGKQWARALLTAGTVVLVARGLAALLTLLSGGPTPDAQYFAEPVPNFVDLASTVLAGLFGGVAAWQLYTKDAAAFFLEHSGVGTKL